MGDRSKGLTKGIGSRANGIPNLLGRTNGLTNGLGRTNGLTNGLGRTNGLTNGLGRTNGLTNGLGRTNGLTNGLGRTNGLTSQGRPRRLNDSAISPSRISLVLILAFALIVPSIFLIFSYNETAYTGLKVDGEFDDWDNAVIHSDSNAYVTASLDIDDYAAGANDAGGLFLYASARANWMSAADVDSLIVFIDADADAGTGYSVNGMGADYVAEAYGWNGSIQGRQLGVFSGQDQSNWSAWNWRGLQAAAALTRMEIGISDSSITLATGHSFLFMTKRGESVADVCDARIALDRGALSVRQIPGDVNGIMANDQIMNLELRACGNAVDVTAVSFTFTGVAAPTVTGLPVTVPAGTAVTLQVTAPVTELASGTFVEVAVSSVTGTGLPTIIGERLAAYANAAPIGIHIDGAFGDWNGIPKITDMDAVSNPDIDIAQFAGVNSTSQAFFYLKVNDAGEMLGGSIVPNARAIPGEPGGPGEPGEPTPAVPLERKTGEDITRIYIDTGAGGLNINGISANYLIEIKGQGGHITSKMLYSLPVKTFIANVGAANLGRELEVGVALGQIDYNGTIQYFMESTDWRNDYDMTDVASFLIAVSGTRNGLGAPEPFAGTLSLINVPMVTATMTIDGDWTTDEWSDAETYDGADFDLYVLQDGTYLYVSVVVSADTAVNQADYCALFFDTDHGEESLPQAEDRQFKATDPDGSVTTEDFNGDNSATWVSSFTASTWSAQGALDEGQIVYEFKISFIDVWGQTNPASGALAGFAVDIRNEDATANYYWGGAGVSTTDLNTWGVLEIPEFSHIAIPTIICCVLPYIAFRARRRSRRE